MATKKYDLTITHYDYNGVMQSYISKTGNKKQLIEFVEKHTNGGLKVEDATNGIFETTNYSGYYGLLWIDKATRDIGDKFH